MNFTPEELRLIERFRRHYRERKRIRRSGLLTALAAWGVVGFGFFPLVPSVLSDPGLYSVLWPVLLLLIVSFLLVGVSAVFKTVENWNGINVEHLLVRMFDELEAIKARLAETTKARQDSQRGDTNAGPEPGHEHG